ncbi:hypothetical protein BpHYR1_020787 [Brachionus plicatilis]|uniref:Uncharacterized protein n=1 Tax=Brachionus plicatilis TaxID=10195 RepID=A0A3M7S7U2_BRAPC|nr:hypothetical protein BpHYR1_020787 [Brachionus plicatilis]
MLARNKKKTSLDSFSGFQSLFQKIFFFNLHQKIFFILQTVWCSGLNRRCLYNKFSENLSSFKLNISKNFSILIWLVGLESSRSYPHQNQKQKQWPYYFDHQSDLQKKIKLNKHSFFFSSPAFNAKKSSSTSQVVHLFKEQI